jgi:hypothetical protein
MSASYPVAKGMGVSVGSLPLPRNCEVLGYVGERCDGEVVEVSLLGGVRKGGVMLFLGLRVLLLLAGGSLGVFLLSVSHWLSD